MQVFLIHHAEVPKADQPDYPSLTAKGREQSDRLGSRFRAIGVMPARILHSDKKWSIETAQHIAAKLGAQDRVGQPDYPIHTGFPIAPFIADVKASKGDIMMCGHTEFITRAAGFLIGGDEKLKAVEFRPGFGTVACLQGEGDQWSVVYVWRQDHPPG